MADFETFVITVYVLVDEYVQAQPPVQLRAGRPAALWPSEALTLALVSQLARFPSERAFARFADQHLRALFPTLPDRSQLNRAIRAQHDALVALGRRLARLHDALTAEYELIDTTAVPIRNAKRRGLGFLPDVAAVGRSMRLGWFCGFRLLLSCTPTGLITGYGLAPGNEQDRTLADTFFAERAAVVQVLPSVGRPASGVYLADTGFAGRAAQTRWAQAHAAGVYAPPQPDAAVAWPPAVRRWATSARQVVETVFGRLHGAFRLERERPHTLGGVLTRVAAKVTLHHLLLHENLTHGRPPFALATIIGW